MRAFLILTLASVGSAAMVSAADTARATYERERAACLSGQSGQDRGTCLREAAAAYQEARGARRGAALPDDPDRYARNARLRCQSLPQAERPECEARMSSGSTSGSVTGGGILREHRSVQPMDPNSANAESQPTPSPQSAPAPASAPQ